MYEDLYNLSNSGLTMYRCNKQNINDVYFAPAGVSMQQDFCTYKDDDFKFIFEILGTFFVRFFVVSLLDRVHRNQV